MTPLAALALLLVPPQAAAAPIEGVQTPRAAVAGGYPYQLFVPRGYAAARRQHWPLVVFLHGSGERGTDLELVKKNGPPKIIGQHPGSPFLLVSPQLEAGGDWDVARLDALLAELTRRYRVDADRIYLTGLSLGAMAAWRWAAAHPERFAALAPVAGRADPAIACRLTDLPIWALHGDNDDVVRPASTVATIEAIRQCPGMTVQPRLTIYPATNHGSWEPAYDDPALWRWLLEQRRVEARSRPR